MIDTNQTVLKGQLIEWTDCDIAAYRIGICLGLMPDCPAFGATKHVFWGVHPVGEMLYTMLNSLMERGILEKREEPDIQYRWSPGFLGSWEKPVL